MRGSTPRSALLAWTLCACVIVFALLGILGFYLAPETHGDIEQLVQGILQQVPYVVFSIVGALIIASQPRNTIGWLLMLMALPSTLLPLFPITSLARQATAANVAPPLATWLLVWLSAWSWWFLIGPLLLIPVLFPTGRPPTPRWRWVIAFLALVFLVFLVMITFGARFEDTEAGISFPNPIGFIPIELRNKFFNGPWTIMLDAAAVLCIPAIFVRYRRAAYIERQQIKWLLFACAFFLLDYLGTNIDNGILGQIFGFGFLLALLAIPIAIGIAILRYRLFDIDVIIRRTLSYALVTALLALIFFGSIIFLQQLFSALTLSGQNEIVTVLSTLAIAALFVPVRNRIQTEIDKRFNRKKYDSQQVLADFANTVRDETNLENLTGRLMQVIDETMQPKSVSVWLKVTKDLRRQETQDSLMASQTTK